MKLSEFKNNVIYWLGASTSWDNCEEVEQLIKVIKNIGEDLKLKGVEPDSKKEGN